MKYMKVVILGAGLMGKEAARDLLRSDAVSRVYLADLHVREAEDFAEEMMSDKLDVLWLDATNEEQLGDVMALGDVTINALFYAFNESVARIAIEKGVHALDLGGHIGGVTDKVLTLHDEAKRKGVTIIPDLGVAPGMINILTGYGAGQLDEVKAIKLYVGGIPVDPEPPLNYNLVFSLDGVFDHYTKPSTVIRKGVIKEIPSLSEIESIQFKGYEGLEAFHTSGGTSTLTKSFQTVETLEYKTIRYEGHAEKFQVLVDLGLISADETVELYGREFKMRDIMREYLTPKLKLGNKSDAVLLRVIVSGKKDHKSKAFEYNLITEKDTSRNVTAMARATASTISIVAQMIGTGIITKRGVYPPEEIVPGKLYIDELKKRGVSIEEQQLPNSL